MSFNSARSAPALEAALAEEHCEQKSQIDPEAQFRERLRIQELLRYFTPHDDGPGPGEEKARLATDTALTALAQLCAHKLNCQRSFISIITDSKQFMVAEATRSISLKDEDQHGEGDGIYLGQCTISFEWGVCPGTIACFTAIDNSLDVHSRYVKASRSYYVMNDMSALEGFKDRPYIAGWPFMKYYAEVPIHSPSGLTIGTLCVVDNKAREGLDMEGLGILREISEVIMNHLELCVSRIHRNNAEKMIQALGKFVEGKDSMREWWIEAQASRVAEPGLQHLSLEKRADIELGSRKEVNTSIDSVVGMSDSRQTQALDVLKPQSGSPGYVHPALSLCTGSSSPEARHLSEASSEIPQSPGTAYTSPDPTPGEEKQGPSLDNQFPSQELSDLETMLNRATNLIREGIGLDGIVLFDPRSSDGQLLTDFNISGEKVAWVDRRSSGISPTAKPVPFSNSSSYFPPFDKQTPQPNKYCKVLASSTRRKSNGDGLAGEGLLVPENILQMLLQLYPRGGILNYDKKGFIDGDDSIFLYPSDCRKIGGKPVIKPGNGVDIDSSMEANKLRSILPEATSVLLLPLWDTNQDKWFAYSLAWTTNPARIFQRQDFTYLASFGNSIMTELSRLETIAADNAKSGFISSISHELRSPLHGIMASVELLRDANTDPVSNAIICTVESCGSTLLDTIENLLTFTKVNRLTARANSVVARRAPSVDLATLVEEVTQMLIAGHYFRRTVEASGAPHQKTTNPKALNSKAAPGLAVICDISPECDWVFKTDAGIWKRILMNLLGNSLKYTSSGFVLVKLRLEEDLPVLESKARPTILATRAKAMSDPDLRVAPMADRLPLERGSTTGTKPTKTFNVTLTIEDSGKGMSQDYLTHHLFKPFYQEDTLSPGTGLGLSIVHQLVSSIGGSAHVTSELNSGTEVRIDVGLQRPDPATALPTLSERPQFNGLRLGLCGLDVVPDLSETPNGILDAIARRRLALRSTLADYAMNLGLSVLTVDSLNSDTADLILATEPEYQRLISSQKSSFQKPLIVLSAEPMMRYGQMNTEFGSAAVLSQPFGPSRFRQAVESCFSAAQKPQAPPKSLAILPKPEIPVAKETSKDALPKDAPIPTIPKTEAIPPPTTQEPLLPSGQKRLSLLLVEDNPINLKLLVASFKKMGHNYSTATDGSLAVAAYRDASDTRNPRFDIIFMDIQMPVMDGMEASLEIRKYEKQNGLQPAIIIALTALTTLQAEQKALDAGADRFMNKPVSIKKLRDVVAECFREGKEGG